MSELWPTKQSGRDKPLLTEGAELEALLGACTGGREKKEGWQVESNSEEDRKRTSSAQYFPHMVGVVKTTQYTPVSQTTQTTPNPPSSTTMTSVDLDS